jgi:hypothetical protein
MKDGSMGTRRKNTRVVTDFPFPPRTTGAWREISRDQRERWLIAARNRHFKWMKRRGGWTDAPPGSVFCIDGAEIADLPAFFCALGEAINGPGGYFGRPSLMSLQDCLFGSFGVTLPFVLQIMNVDACRTNLGGRALAEWARSRIAAGDFPDEEGEQWLLDAERDGRGGDRSLLDEVLDVLRFHGVTIEL